MENLFSNATPNSKAEECVFGPDQITILSLVDICTFLTGEAVVSKLMWIIFTSRKSIDILNCNLALLHTVHYLMSFIHLIFMFLLPQYQTKLLKILLAFAQSGGSLSLSFICMERYIAVIYPTSYRLLKKYRCRVICALTVWLLTAFYVVTSNIDNAPPFTEWVLRVLPWCLMSLTCIMMMYYNIRILRALKKSAPSKDELNPAKKRAFIIIRATTVINLSCYIPVTVLQRFIYMKEPTYDCVIIPACITLLSFASLVHPLFYLSTQGKLCTCLKGEKKVR